MALSNMFREPRRELTETAIGLALFGCAVGADYLFARWLQYQAGYSTVDQVSKANIPWGQGMCIGVILACVCTIIAMVAHIVGESICDRLQDGGIRLRPLRRHEAERLRATTVRLRLPPLR